MMSQKMSVAEINATTNAAIIGGFDPEARAKAEKAREQRTEELIANGGRTVAKMNPVLIDSYKLRFIPASALWLSYFSEELSKAYVAISSAAEAYQVWKTNKTYKNRQAFDTAKEAANAAYFALEQAILSVAKTDEPYIVHEDDCFIRTNRRSLASDIAGVLYQRPEDELYIDNNIVMLHHDTYNIVPRSWMLAQSTKDAEKRSEALAKNLIFSLLRKGVAMVGYNGRTTKYDFWASSSSHQKVGIVYLGEHNMMVRTERIRNFGATFEQINAAGGDNGSEYIKRQAVLFTPSVPIIDPITLAPLTLNDVLMLPDVKVSRKAANVAHVDDDANITLENGIIDATQGDGQAYALCDWLRSLQMRGFDIKAFCVKADAAMHFVHPSANKLDLDGNPISLAGKKVAMTKSCWKGDKLGFTWQQFVDMANELSQECEFVNQLRVVRWADSAGDKIRHLSRQSIQQWITASESEIEALISGAKKELQLRKKLSGALLFESAMSKPDEERTPYNKVLEARPSILCSNQFQLLLKDQWHNNLAERAAGRIKIKGQYPYIAMDPVAMLQVLLEDRDPNDPTLGFLKEGEVNLPNVTEGQEVYGIRYPNNFLCGMVLKQKNHVAYVDCGDVAILPYHGFAIVRADGDFDGDEMLFCTMKLIVNMMKKVIEKVNPPLIDFPHVKAKRHPVNEFKTRMEIAIALYNGQAFNKVGQYSNVAMKLFSQIAIADEQPNFMSGIGRQIILAHVATILVIDMVKTGTMPPAIQKAVEDAGKQIKMPYSQIFNDHWNTPYWKNTECDVPSKCVADQVAQKLIQAVGQYEFDTEGVVFDGNSLLAKVPEEYAKRQAPKGTIDPEVMAAIKRYNYCEEDNSLLQLAAAGKRVGFKDMTIYFWRNERAMCRTFTLSNEDGDKETTLQIEEYYEVIRQILLNHGDTDLWLELDEDLRHRLVYNHAIKTAFELSKPNAAGKGYPTQELADAAKAAYARFIVRVFAEDIIKYSDEE